VSINAEKFVPVLEKDWPEFIDEMKGKPHAGMMSRVVTNYLFRNRRGSWVAISNSVGDESSTRNINGPGGRWLHFICMENGRCLSPGPELGCKLSSHSLK
jgi:hypothetical protein